MPKVSPSVLIIRLDAIGDALALTYARTVFPRETLDWLGNANNVVSEYDPFAPESEWPDRRNESRLIQRNLTRFPEGMD